MILQTRFRQFCVKNVTFNAKRARKSKFRARFRFRGQVWGYSDACFIQDCLGMSCSMRLKA